MRKIFLIFSTVLLLSSCSERSNIVLEGDIKIANLYGTWQQMGQDFGRLASAELSDIDSFITAKLDGDSTKIANATKLSEDIYRLYPARFKQYMKGMAEGSGLSLEKILLLNALEYAENFFQCSATAVWDEYSKEGKLIYGRNYDACTYEPLYKDIIITVFHPSDGSIPTATIGYAGEVYAVNGFNARGLFMELNNGTFSGGKEIDFSQFMATTKLMEALFDAENLDYFDAFFKSTSCNLSFIIGVADSTEARSYEWCRAKTFRADTLSPDGKMIMTNHFVTPQWNCCGNPDEFFLSAQRRCYLDSVTTALKGQIDVAKMCEIMDHPLDEGGVKHPQYTLYQLVYQPSTFTLQMQVKGLCKWTEIDLRKYF